MLEAWIRYHKNYVHIYENQVRPRGKIVRYGLNAVIHMRLERTRWTNLIVQLRLSRLTQR
jgi:hypothetical protein